MKPTKKNKKKLRQQLSDFFHSSAALRLLVCVVGLAMLVSIYVVAIVPVRYDLRVGMVPNATITATKDVVDEIATTTCAGETPVEEQVMEKVYFVTPESK